MNTEMEMTQSASDIISSLHGSRCKCVYDTISIALLNSFSLGMIYIINIFYNLP